MSASQAALERVRGLARDESCDPTIRSWVVGSFVSLRAAEELGYQADAFHRRFINDPEWGMCALEMMLESSQSGNVLLHPGSGEDLDLWRSGYFFNNALMRIAALTENGLKVLWERAHGEMPEDFERVTKYDFWGLVAWYEKVFAPRDGFRGRLQRLRRKVNAFKHEHRSAEYRGFDDIEEAWLALLDVVDILQWPHKEPQALRAKEAQANWSLDQSED
jgi:hypothetical protein